MVKTQLQGSLSFVVETWQNDFGKASRLQSFAEARWVNVRGGDFDFCGVVISVPIDRISRMLSGKELNRQKLWSTV